MPTSAKDFKIKHAETNYEKKSIVQILNESEFIDVEKASTEVLQWVTNNVEEFIDNQKRIFKLDLIIDAEEGAEETMHETKKLQDLYRAIPEDPELDVEDADAVESMYDSLTDEQKEVLQQIQDCRDALDQVTSNVHDAILANTEKLNELFDRMGFYYEMKGVDRGTLLVQEMSGEVDILKFEYESFPVAVKVLVRKDMVGNLLPDEKVVFDEYMIPEGFTIWLEVAFKAVRQEIGMF